MADGRNPSHSSLPETDGAAFQPDNGETRTEREPVRCVEAVSEVTGTPIEEQSHHNADTSMLYYRRDLLRLLTAINDEAIRNIRRSESPPPTYLQCTDIEIVERTLEPYGKGKGISEGSIILHLQVCNSAQARRLLSDLSDGTLAQRLKACLKDEIKLPSQMTDFKVEVDAHKIKKIEDFLKLDTVDKDIFYTYCKKLNAWIWSVDNENWHGADEFVVQKGELKGKALQQEDIELLIMLSGLEDDSVQIAEKDCYCCCREKLHPTYTRPEPRGSSKAPNEIDIRVSWADMDALQRQKGDGPTQSTTKPEDLDELLTLFSRGKDVVSRYKNTRESISETSKIRILTSYLKSFLADSESKSLHGEGETNVFVGP